MRACRSLLSKSVIAKARKNEALASRCRSQPQARHSPSRERRKCSSEKAESAKIASPLRELDSLASSISVAGSLEKDAIEYSHEYRLLVKRLRLVASRPPLLLALAVPE